MSDDQLRNGHEAKSCPARINVQLIQDSHPRYLHGRCDPESMFDRSEIHAYITNKQAEHRFAIAFNALGKALKAEETSVRLMARERIALAVLQAIDALEGE